MDHPGEGPRDDEEAGDLLTPQGEGGGGCIYGRHIGDYAKTKKEGKVI